MIGSIDRWSGNHHRQSFILSGGEETGHQTFHVEAHSPQGSSMMNIIPTRIDGKTSADDYSIIQFYYKLNDQKFDIYIKTTSWTSFTYYSIIPLSKGSMTFITPTISSLTESDLMKANIRELAKTSKIDISLVNQWKKGIGDMNQYVSKNGNTVTVNISIIGGIPNENTVIFTLPEEFRPNSNVVIAGAKNWSKEEVVRFITVRMNGEVVLRRGFNSSDTYILDFSFSIK